MQTTNNKAPPVYRPGLYLRLNSLSQALSELRSHHAYEIEHTAHLIERNGHTTAFRLDRSLDSVEDYLNDAIDTFEAANGLGEYSEVGDEPCTERLTGQQMGVSI